MGLTNITAAVECVHTESIVDTQPLSLSNHSIVGLQRYECIVALCAISIQRNVHDTPIVVPQTKIVSFSLQFELTLCKLGLDDKATIDFDVEVSIFSLVLVVEP